MQLLELSWSRSCGMHGSRTTCRYAGNVHRVVMGVRECECVRAGGRVHAGVGVREGGTVGVGGRVDWV